MDVHELGKEAELVGYMVVSDCHGAKVRLTGESWKRGIWGGGRWALRVLGSDGDGGILGV